MKLYRQLTAEELGFEQTNEMGMSTEEYKVYLELSGIAAEQRMYDRRLRLRLLALAAVALIIILILKA